MAKLGELNVLTVSRWICIQFDVIELSIQLICTAVLGPETLVILGASGALATAIARIMSFSS